MEPRANPRSIHILILVDRDWTHPQAGGNGTNLYAQIARWVAWGHRVTVVAGSYPGAKPVEQFSPNLAVYRKGGRSTVFAWATWAVLRGVGRDADVVLEVVNGITFLTPLWLRKPRVVLVHHVHRDLYVNEFGRLGRFLAWALEAVPLRYLYRDAPFLTISRAARDDLVRVGIPADNITVEYLGVEPGSFGRGVRAREPRLLYLGRLKAYKRIENILDVLQAVPGATLDIAGDGDHRDALEAEIDRRGLSSRVQMHGYVDEARKKELYGRAWIALTASSSEGWSLTVMEAALCGTPSAALAVGGLSESIVDGETGVLAHEPDELCRRVREVVARPDVLERLGDEAERRAKTFTWDRPAATNLDVLRREAAGGRSALGENLGPSGTAQAAAVAALTLAGHAIGAIFAFTLARLLGATDYGSLAALLSAFIILAIPGSALQVATAREATMGRLGAGALSLHEWTRMLVASCVTLAGVGVVIRQPLAEVIGVSQDWAAAALLPTIGLWLLVSIQRGALQGLGAYRALGWSIVLEGAWRLAIAVALVLLSAGVTGAFVATPLSLIAISAAQGMVLRRRAAPAQAGRPRRRRRDVLGKTKVIVVGLTLLAVLQNLDVILVRHELGGSEAGAYAAAALAAKTLVWVAIGMGLYLLPEAARLSAAGVSPRPALRRALVIVGTVCAPVLAVFCLLPDRVLTLAFGSELSGAADQLPALALAMALLAVACLTIQYMLVLGRVLFVPLLGAIALIEPLILSTANDLAAFATLVLVLQAIAAVALLALSVRATRPGRLRDPLTASEAGVSPPAQR
jgi:glycosyltransferase involved in cell wall biosynthesis/O-antigen/teichoic acid export membrane protein